MSGMKNTLVAVLWQYHPWWRTGGSTDLPSWRRAAFHEVLG